MKQYVIFGDSAFAERICNYIRSEHVHKVLCFTNEERYMVKDKINDLDVVPFEQLSERYDKDSFELIICIGYVKMNRLREQIYDLCRDEGYRVGSWISSTVISYSDDVADGNIVMPNVYIGPNCSIGRGNVIASSCCLSHDNKLGDFNFISSSVIFGGHSSVCDNCFIGLNSTVRDGIIINNYSLIGSASNILKNTDEEGVYVGNPAYKLENKRSSTTKI